MLRARDVMSTNLISIPTTATVEDAIRSLLEHRVTGAPIVDEQGNLAGIVSEFQLLEAIYQPDVKKRRVDDLMTKDVITVADDAALFEVANLFLLHRIRRVLVTSDGQITGIVTRRDLLRATVEEYVGEPVTACSP